MSVKHDANKLGANGNKSYKNLFKKIIIYMFLQRIVLFLKTFIKDGETKHFIKIQIKNTLHAVSSFDIPNIHTYYYGDKLKY